MVIAPINEDAEFNSDEFYQRMGDYLALSQIDFNNPDKAKLDLGKLVADDENFVAGANDKEVMMLRSALSAQSEQKLFKYTQKNFKSISEKLDDNGLVSLVFQIPSEKGVSGGDDKAVSAIEKLHKAEEKSKEDPLKYVSGELDKVHEDFREIVARYGAQAIVQSSLNSLQSKVLSYFSTKEGAFAKDKAEDFIKAYMDHYTASSDEEAQMNGRIIGMSMARAAYQTIDAQKQQQEQAKKLYDEVNKGKRKNECKKKKK